MEQTNGRGLILFLVQIVAEIDNLTGLLTFATVFLNGSAGRLPTICLPLSGFFLIHHRMVENGPTRYIHLLPWLERKPGLQAQSRLPVWDWPTI